MNLMAVETAELAMVHIALDEIISLHPVLMCGQVWILVEVGISGLDLFKPPVVGQTFSRELIECSSGWFRLLAGFWPAIRHWPDFDTSGWFCALSNRAKGKILINAIIGIETSRFFMGIVILLLDFGLWLRTHRQT